MRLTEEQRERRFKEDDAIVCKEKSFVIIGYFLFKYSLARFLHSPHLWNTTKRSDINVNFRDVIEMLIEAKKPIIGHNCFLDFCQKFTNSTKKSRKKCDSLKR